MLLQLPNALPDSEAAAPSLLESATPEAAAKAAAEGELPAVPGVHFLNQVWAEDTFLELGTPGDNKQLLRSIFQQRVSCTLGFNMLKVCCRYFHVQGWHFQDPLQIL